MSHGIDFPDPNPVQRVKPDRLFELPGRGPTVVAILCIFYARDVKLQLARILPA